MRCSQTSSLAGRVTFLSTCYLIVIVVYYILDLHLNIYQAMTLHSTINMRAL